MITRGNNRQTIFHDDADYQRYLGILSCYAAEHELKIHHFALMPNHVHLLLVVSRGAALSRAMRGINLTYALHYQRRHQYRGHVWQGRFQSLLIDRPGLLLQVGRDIELHPVRSGLVEDAGAHRWSSYPVYANGAASSLVVPNPLYALLGSTARERQDLYRTFVREGLREEAGPSPIARRGRPRKSRAAASTSSVRAAAPLPGDR